MDSHKISLTDIPEEIQNITQTLEKAGFEAYLVGGCVRDMLLNKTPKDWDVTTNATPEQITELFPETFYENSFGTVGVVNEGVENETLKVVEVTPYRIEGKYSDKRRPDEVIFSTNIEDDLKRRDFTINAFAYSVSQETLIDLYSGMEDLRAGVIRTVGDPVERFNEDGLRILRAVRFHAELGFTIDSETEKALLDHGDLLEHIAKERIRDEFVRIIMSDNPEEGLSTAKKLGIVSHIAPELIEGEGIEQTDTHAYDVFTHLLKTLQHSAKKDYPLHVRLAALFHDIAKPATRRKGKTKYTFYGHEVVGARMTKKIMERLAFSKDLTETVTNLVRWHMFFADTEQITHSAVRRLIQKVGKEYIWDLMNLRACDRIGTGRPKEQPYRLRKYKAMVEEVMSDPVSVGMLKINGDILIAEHGMKPGREIGYILHALLEEVIEDPDKNTEEYLSKRAVELSNLPAEELKALGEAGKDTQKEEEEKQIKEIRGKYWVE